MLGRRPGAHGQMELGMAGIYLGGRRYDLALAQVQAVADAEGTAERWETPLETTRKTARE